MPTEVGGWPEWQRLVLKELERLSGEVKDVRDELQHARTEIAVLKRDVQIRAGLAGGIAGAIAVIGGALLLLLSGRLG